MLITFITIHIQATWPYSVDPASLEGHPTGAYFDLTSPTNPHLSREVNH